MEADKSVRDLNELVNILNYKLLKDSVSFK